MKKRSLLSFFIIAILILSVALTGCSQNAQAPAPKDEPAASGNGDAKEFPHDKLTVVIPYKAGGTNDRQARALAPYIEQTLGVPIEIENRPGGGTTVAYHSHKDKDPADGSYVVFGHHTAFSKAVVAGEYKYEEFDPLGSMSTGHPVLMINPKHNDIKDFKEFLELVKANPDEYSQPVGAGWSAVFDIVLNENGLKTRAIPVDGGSDDRVMFMAGDVDYYVSDIESNVAILDPSDYRVLAVLSEVSPYGDQFAVANDVMKELGYTTFPNMATPRYFQAKSEFKDEYPLRFEYLSEKLMEATEKPDFVKLMKEAGYVIDAQPPAEVESIFYDYYQSVLKYKDAFQ